MKYWNDMVLKRIKETEQIEKLNQYRCEIEPNNLYMGCCYEAASFIIPKDYTIIDLGCYMAAQAFLFEEYNGYIGVDIYDSDRFAPSRFKTKNATHYSMTIEEFLDNIVLFKNPDQYYVIMNAVPGEYIYAFNNRILLDKIYAKFPNTIVDYPGFSTEIRGVFAEDMTHFTELIENTKCPYTDSYLKRFPDEVKKWKAVEEEVFKEIESYILSKEEAKAIKPDEDLDR